MGPIEANTAPLPSNMALVFPNSSRREEVILHMKHLLPRPRFAAATAAFALGAQLLSSSASAHIELQSPLNRYSDIKSGDNKACPCGSGTTNRDCRKPEEHSDPDRSADRATTFAPGDTISVTFDEYVGHSGRYRIAFDPSGADLEDFNDNILLDEPDPTGALGNIGDDSIWEFEVTLPEMTCDNCTLQLIQVMDGNTTDEVLNPVDRGGTYFQCADIVLAEGTPAGGIAPLAPTDHLGQRNRPNVAPVAMTTPEMAANPATTGSGMGSTSTATDSGRNTGSAALTPSTATAVDSSAPSLMDASEGQGGCSLVTGLRPQGSWPALGALAAVLLASGLRAQARRRR